MNVQRFSKFEKRRFKHWSPEIQKQLKSLCFRQDGEMLGEVTTDPDIWTFVIFGTDYIIGWGILNNENEAMVYVRGTERRKGYGRTIIQAIMRSARGEISVFEHDRRSKLWYADVRSKTRTKRLVDRW